MAYRSNPAAANLSGFIIPNSHAPISPAAHHITITGPCLVQRFPNLAPGATAKTDGWPAYPGVKHDVVGKMAAHIVLPWVHRIFANLKVWALGVYYGLRRKHLQSYLDEFVFRFNRRHTRHAAFRSLLGIATGHPPFSYKMLILPETKA